MKKQVEFLELLQIDYKKYPVIAVVGGGGKTSLIYRLADELLDRGKKVIITTTTHMAGESELPFARGGDAVDRMERTSKFLKKSLEAPITEEDIVKIATSICGLFKDVEERIYRVYMNKSDVLSEKTPAEYIVEELEKKHTVAAYGSLWEE